GRSALGRRRILRQSWRDSPTSERRRSDINPKFAAKNKWSRIATAQRNNLFVHSHRTARRDWLAGKDVVFPAGTFWLRRYANVKVAPTWDSVVRAVDFSKFS